MKSKIDLPPVEEVVLPKLFNLRPGYYLLGLIVLVLLLLIFLIGFLPGIRKGGRYVTFGAPLSETGILLDGKYLGSATHQYFVPSGDHTVAYVKADHTYAETSIHVDHPVFLTNLIRRTLEIPSPPITLSDEETASIVSFLLEEIQEISKSLDYPPQFPYQPVYADLYNDLEALGIRDTRPIVDLALSLISNDTMRKEAERFFPVEDPPAASEPENDRILPPVGRPTILVAGDLIIEGYAYEGSSFTMGDGAGPQSDYASVSTPDFVLARRPVSQYEWALFIEENPKWSKSAVDDPSYLSGLSLSTRFSTNRPIYNVSYHAARAFVQWLSQKSGKEVFLPTEAMWSQAAYSQEHTEYDTSLALSERSVPLLGLLGGVWEMT
ncbi:MAG: SUMF1/EgtB/PvdO family nonheme iron enzyme, partial [Spirochaetales bacterium]|nr:SUMF1/EgtB/PvdO family nonheme iron enzyme [Spirochaetales bacterium]